MARLISETIRLWFKVLAEVIAAGGKLYADVSKAWNFIAGRMLEDAEVTRDKFALYKITPADNLVTGIMSNVIALLIKLYWTPIKLEVWKDNRTGDVYQLTNVHLFPTPLVNSLIE